MIAVPAWETGATPPVQRYLGVMLIVVVLPSVLGFAIAQELSDGPLTAIIPGGPLRSGPLVTEPVEDWSTVLGEAATCSGDACAAPDPIELQLVEPPTSRYVGVVLHDGHVYLPCDLGFMWNRFGGTERRVLQLIYYFKHWHKDALRDGRAVLRIDGKRYAGHATRVTDPQLLAELKVQLEVMARHWVAPDPLPPAPAEAPNDIWFFRFDQGDIDRGDAAAELS